MFSSAPPTKGVMRKHGVQHEAWGPLGQGGMGLFDNEVLAEIATAHDKTVAQVALRWLTQRGIVVIPKSVHRERMVQNHDAFGFDLTDDEMTRIAALETGRSGVFDHRDPEGVQSLGTTRFDT